MEKRAYVLIVGIALAAIVALFIFTSSTTSSFESVANFDGDIKIYKSLNCGCCGLYSSYFKNKGNSNVKIINLESVDLIKKNYGVPSSMESCHTTIIGNYFIEGHVPLDAVEKLLQEKPDIKGIAMPGMPSGSPGMPGSKVGDFVIYSVNHDGSYEEFMRL